jgi:hypothetical protein
MTEGKSWWTKNLNGTLSHIADEGDLPIHGTNTLGYKINLTATNKQAADQLQLHVYFKAAGEP